MFESRARRPKTRGAGRVLLLMLLMACGGSAGADATPGDASTDRALDVDLADRGRDAEGFDAQADDAFVDGDDGSAPQDAALPSRCTVSETRIDCARRTLQLRTGATALTNRDVHYQFPRGEAPEGGFPVVLMFQGSLFTAGLSWVGELPGPFGSYYQTQTLQQLLDAGFAVITPEARFEGSTFWDTNVPPFNVFWETSGDHRLMERIFEAIEAGEFGPLDGDRLYATGISSGGYMTSRMAVSYSGRFRALAVVSASYATCSGAVCLVPELPEDHPPTLFVHGSNDLVVPPFTMESYRDALLDDGVAVDTLLDPEAAHEWFAGTPAAIVDWFQRATDT